MNEGEEQLRGLVIIPYPRISQEQLCGVKQKRSNLDVKKDFLTMMKMKSSPQKVLSEGELLTVTIQWIGEECFFSQSILGIQDCTLPSSSLILPLLHYCVL